MKKILVSFIAMMGSPQKTDSRASMSSAPDEPPENIRLQ
uniref:Uncharacterized protein n=1 Tax=Klebsiella pneumoniae TaxID=573 RepID=A0A6G9HTW4_KLEPN|nr:hypothetical protein [Klebsiella pneumoniae]